MVLGYNVFSQMWLCFQKNVSKIFWKLKVLFDLSFKFNSIIDSRAVRNDYTL